MLNGRTIERRISLGREYWQNHHTWWFTRPRQYTAFNQANAHQMLPLDDLLFAHQAHRSVPARMLTWRKPGSSETADGNVERSVVRRNG